MNTVRRIIQVTARLRAMVPVLALLLAGGWIDYTDRVEQKTPAFGREYRSFSLMLHTAKAEFELGTAQPVTVVLRNAGDETRLATDDKKERFLHLYIAAADPAGTTYFSNDLLPADHVARTGSIPKNRDTPLLGVSFDSLRFAKVESFVHGLPKFPATDQGWFSALDLVPKLYVMKAMLLSGVPNSRPDFAVASDAWPVLVRPMAGDRMTDQERNIRLQKYLQKLRQGAYGGMAVSSQLAALGETSVDALIEIADQTGEERTRESRIWAIVTLCNTGSPRALSYIKKRLVDPVALGDLNFLAWHSQGFGSNEIPPILEDLARQALTGRELPWERPNRTVSDDVKHTFLEFVFKHFATIRRDLPEDIVRAALAGGNPKTATFALGAWRPKSAREAASVVSEQFVIARTGEAHPNLKRAILQRLAQADPGSSFPGYRRDAPLDEQWQNIELWLQNQGWLPKAR